MERMRRRRTKSHKHSPRKQTRASHASSGGLSFQITNPVRRVATSLFTKAENQERFLLALQQPKPFPRVLVWMVDPPAQIPFRILQPEWYRPDFVDVLFPEEKPGQHALHADGAYYILSLSSVILASVMHGVQPSPEGVLDVCAAPGGKAIFCSRLLNPEVLICNEVIGKRAGQLISNLKRCRIPRTCVIHRDSSVLSAHFADACDLVIVDAPCSGQSLVCEELSVPNAFHPAVINKNANRQKRILANSLSMVRPDGFLAYMTCTFSREENEAVIEWALRRFPEFEPCQVSPMLSFQSELADFPCYRVWPYDNLGAGGFAVLLRRKAAQSGKTYPSLAMKLSKATQSIKARARSSQGRGLQLPPLRIFWSSNAEEVSE